MCRRHWANKFLGSARVSRAVCGALAANLLPKAKKVRFGEAPKPTRGARVLPNL